VSVTLAEATSIDVHAKKVILSDGELPFDYLILATGATHAYFGRDEWAPYAPGLKSIEDALDIRRRILLAYEQAEREQDPDLRRALLTFLIAGGGPTGVELAGALAEISRHALAHDFKNIDPTQARVVLIEGLDRILPTFPPELSEKAHRQLARLGVEVLTSSIVTSIDPGGVSLGTPGGVSLGTTRLEARTVLWAAGVAASPLARSLGVPLDHAGRVLVDRDLTIPGRKDVFVIGDLALLQQDGKPVPGVAQAAMQEGRHVARNIAMAIEGRSYEPFRYVEKGMLATIGRSAAVADLPRIKLSGFFAWLIWLVVHIYFLIGFRNRVLVLIQWAWAYLTYQRGARLITGDIRHILAQRSAAPGKKTAS
jgi:NADH dehydrogenase